jgi:hypothetical protein
MAEGLKITQRGTDISRAADYQTVLDSRWPLLEIILEKQIDVTLTPSGVDGYQVVKLLDHNNNSLPGFEFYQDTSVVDPAYATALNGYSLVYTKNSVYISSLYVGASSHTLQPYRLKGFLRLYRTDFNKQFKSDTITISPEKDTDDKVTGLKILDENKAGANMRRPDYDNYSLNTNAKAMSMHMMDNVLPDATTHFATVTHGLGYLPTFMAWQSYRINYNTNSDGTYTDDGATFQSPLKGQDAISELVAFSFANTATLSFRGVQSPLANRVAYVILKDPLVVAV